jgi:hypothetical protein
MLQMVATISSLILLALAVGVIASAVSSDWALMLRALRHRAGTAMPPLPPHGRPVVFARQIRVTRITPQSSPQRAAA